jgi:hypothetical protein
MSGTLEPVQPPKNEPPPDPTWRGVEFSSTLFLLCPLPGPKSSRLSRQDSSPSPKNYVLRPDLGRSLCTSRFANSLSFPTTVTSAELGSACPPQHVARLAREGGSTWELYTTRPLVALD